MMLLWWLLHDSDECRHLAMRKNHAVLDAQPFPIIGTSTDVCKATRANIASVFRRFKRAKGCILFVYCESRTFKYYLPNSGIVFCLKIVCKVWKYCNFLLFFCVGFHWSNDESTWSLWDCQVQIDEVWKFAPKVNRRWFLFGKKML